MVGFIWDMNFAPMVRRFPSPGIRPVVLRPVGGAVGNRRLCADEPAYDRDGVPLTECRRTRVPMVAGGVEWRGHRSRSGRTGQTGLWIGTIEHMFVASPRRPDADTPCPEGPLPGRKLDRQRDLAALALLAERTRPVSSSQTRILPVAPPLGGLFPDGSLRRGTTIVVSGPGGGTDVDRAADGSVSVALALLTAASGAGSWCALVGLDGLGAVAACEAGIDLARLAVIPRPDAAWAEATAALIDGMDLVVLCPPFPPRQTMARKLVARARERRSILVVVPGRAGWPDPPDLHLSVGETRWDGAGTGEGFLSRRSMTVTATGRRSAARPRHRRLWLPSPTGALADAGSVGPT